MSDREHFAIDFAGIFVPIGKLGILCLESIEIFDHFIQEIFHVEVSEFDPYAVLFTDFLILVPLGFPRLTGGGFVVDFVSFREGQKVVHHGLIGKLV